MAFGDMEPSRLDRKMPAVRHSVAGIDREVEESGLHLWLIDDDAGVMLINNQNGGGLINNGTIESTGTGILSLKDVTVTGTGSIIDDHQLKLDDAARGYDLFERREALKVLLTP